MICGSPPRAWGRRGQLVAEIVEERFTPTCVGTTQVPGFRAGGWTVHPHVRGDDELFRLSWPDIVGSPPRAWGRRDSGKRSRVIARFTPTCVGTTHSA